MNSLTTEARLLRVISVLAERAGNPYHDADGKFTAATRHAEADHRLLAKELGSRRSIAIYRRLDMHHSRVHKAGEAWAILKHCLRRTGLLSAYKAGELTGQQALDLLESLREYGRSWLRHEAEVFARRHLDYAGPTRAFEPYGPTEATKAFAAHVGRFFRRAKTFVRELVVAGAMAVLGPAPLTGEDLDAAEAQAQRQEQFFDLFQADVVKAPPIISPETTTEQVVYPPRMTPGEFIARTEQYGNSVYSSGQEVARARYIQGKVFDQERGYHVGADEPCPTCVERVNLGWQPIGTLRPIGDSECRCHCHCHLAYRLSSVPDVHYLLGKGGPMRAPKEA